MITLVFPFKVAHKYMPRDNQVVIDNAELEVL